MNRRLGLLFFALVMSLAGYVPVVGAKMIAVYSQEVIIISAVSDEIQTLSSSYAVASSSLLGQAEGYIGSEVRVLKYSMGDRDIITDIRSVEDSPFTISSPPVAKPVNGKK